MSFHKLPEADLEASRSLWKLMFSRSNVNLLLWGPNSVNKSKRVENMSFHKLQEASRSFLPCRDDSTGQHPRDICTLQPDPLSRGGPERHEKKRKLLHKRQIEITTQSTKKNHYTIFSVRIDSLGSHQHVPPTRPCVKKRYFLRKKLSKPLKHICTRIGYRYPTSCLCYFCRVVTRKIQ